MATAGAEWLTVIGLAEALFFTITATVVGGCSVSLYTKKMEQCPWAVNVVLWNNVHVPVVMVI